MAKLIFINGKVKEVSYSVASEIKYILDGHREPKNAKQEEYLNQIDTVLFDPPKKQTIARPHKDREPDLALRAMMQDPKLSGKSKFDRIGKHLRGKI